MTRENISIIEETAQLLYVSITREKEEEIARSFEELLQYFKVMDLVSTDSQTTCSTDIDTDTNQSIGVLRDDVARFFTDTQSLINRSEEHEEEYIVIPNIL